jgi:hypothetical protein
MAATPRRDCALPGCANPADRWAICDPHAQRTIRLLIELTARLHDLDIAITRQDRITAESTRRRTRAGQPLPYNADAARVLDTVTRRLRDRARALAPARSFALTPARVLAVWLLEHTQQALAWDQALDTATTMAAVAKQIDDITDRPPMVLYAGVCGGRRASGTTCEAELYAEPGAATVTCPLCRTRRDVDARRAIMRRHIDGMLLNLGETVRLASYFEQVDRARARKLLDAWRRRGRIAPAGTDRQGRELYSFGQLLEMLLTAERKPAARRPRGKAASV